VGDRITTLLTSPAVVFSTKHCPTLRGTVRAMTLGPYKQRKVRQAIKKEDSKDKVAAESRRRKKLVKIDKS
jgi:hypothetical protein